MRIGALVGSALLTGLALGCGSSGSGYPTSGGNKSGTNTPTGSGPAGAGVAIMEYAFTPDTVTVKAGAAVTWTNNGTVAHTATADGGAFDSGQLDAQSSGGGYGGGYGGGTAAGSYSFTFTQAGTYTYHCSNHPTTMKGAVVVTP